jgi:DnaJ-class molecular chaperone
MTESDPLGPGGEAPATQEGAGENVCSACSGTGRVDGRQCEACGGSGVVAEPISGA